MCKPSLVAIEYALPADELTNDEIARRFPGLSAPRIESKTGIRSRRVSRPGQTAADIAELAARKLFATDKTQPDQIDFLLFCSQTPDYLLPSTSCLLHHRLGLRHSAGAVDVNQGCSGYVYSLAIASGLIESGIANRVLLVTADTYTKLIHPEDATYQTIFGDGASASLIVGLDDSDDNQPAIGPFEMGTDGSGAGYLMVKAGGARHPLSPHGYSDLGPRDAYLTMDGPAIFTFALKTVPVLVDTLCRKGGVTIDDIDLFVFHQANRFMLESLRDNLGIPPDQFVISMSDQGNTVSSTIPIALRDWSKHHVVRPGMRAMLVGFGVGLSWSGTLVRLAGPL